MNELTRVLGAARHGVSALPALLGAFLLSACSLPLPVGSDIDEVLLGYTEDAPEHGLSRRIVPGLDLRLGEWAGIRLGWTDLRRLEARKPSAESRDLSTGIRYTPPLGVAWRMKNGTSCRLGLVFAPHVPASGEPTFFHHIHIGAGVHFGSRVQGFHAGYSGQTILDVPAEGDGVYWLYYDGRDFRGSHFTEFRSSSEQSP